MPTHVIPDRVAGALLAKAVRQQDQFVDDAARNQPLEEAAKDRFLRLPLRMEETGHQRDAVQYDGGIRGKDQVRQPGLSRDPLEIAAGQVDRGLQRPGPGKGLSMKVVAIGIPH